MIAGPISGVTASLRENEIKPLISFPGICHQIIMSCANWNTQLIHLDVLEDTAIQLRAFFKIFTQR